MNRAGSVINSGGKNAFSKLYLRVHPLDNEKNIVSTDVKMNQICLQSLENQDVTESWILSHIFDTVDSDCNSFATQKTVWHEMKGLIEEYLQSRRPKLTVLVIGPAGSGKTHTLYGNSIHSQRGIIPRYLEYQFSFEESQLTASFIQIRMYLIQKEKIIDLLDPPKVYFPAGNVTETYSLGCVIAPLKVFTANSALQGKHIIGLGLKACSIILANECDVFNDAHIVLSLDMLFDFDKSIRHIDFVEVAGVYTDEISAVVASNNHSTSTGIDPFNGQSLGRWSTKTLFQVRELFTSALQAHSRKKITTGKSMEPSTSGKLGKGDLTGGGDSTKSRTDAGAVPSAVKVNEYARKSLLTTILHDIYSKDSLSSLAIIGCIRNNAIHYAENFSCLNFMTKMDEFFTKRQQAADLAQDFDEKDLENSAPPPPAGATAGGTTAANNNNNKDSNGIRSTNNVVRWRSIYLPYVLVACRQEIQMIREKIEEERIAFVALQIKRAKRKQLMTMLINDTVPTITLGNSAKAGGGNGSNSDTRASQGLITPKVSDETERVVLGSRRTKSLELKLMKVRYLNVFIEVMETLFPDCKDASIGFGDDDNSLSSAVAMMAANVSTASAMKPPRGSYDPGDMSTTVSGKGAVAVSAKRKKSRQVSFMSTTFVSPLKGRLDNTLSLFTKSLNDQTVVNISMWIAQEGVVSLSPAILWKREENSEIDPSKKVLKNAMAAIVHHEGENEPAKQSIDEMTTNLTQAQVIKQMQGTLNQADIPWDVHCAHNLSHKPYLVQLSPSSLCETFNRVDIKRGYVVLKVSRVPFLERQPLVTNFLADSDLPKFKPVPTTASITAPKRATSSRNLRRSRSSNNLAANTSGKQNTKDSTKNGLDEGKGNEDSQEIDEADGGDALDDEDEKDNIDDDSDIFASSQDELTASIRIRDMRERVRKAELIAFQRLLNELAEKGVVPDEKERAMMAAATGGATGGLGGETISSASGGRRYHTGPALHNDDAYHVFTLHTNYTTPTGAADGGGNSGVADALSDHRDLIYGVIVNRLEEVRLLPTTWFVQLAPPVHQSSPSRGHSQQHHNRPDHASVASSNISSVNSHNTGAPGKPGSNSSARSVHSHSSSASSAHANANKSRIFKLNGRKIPELFDPSNITYDRFSENGILLKDQDVLQIGLRLFLKVCIPDHRTKNVTQNPPSQSNSPVKGGVSNIMTVPATTEDSRNHFDVTLNGWENALLTSYTSEIPMLIKAFLRYENHTGHLTVNRELTAIAKYNERTAWMQLSSFDPSDHEIHQLLSHMSKIDQYKIIELVLAAKVGNLLSLFTKKHVLFQCQFRASSEETEDKRTAIQQAYNKSIAHDGLKPTAQSVFFDDPSPLLFGDKFKGGGMSGGENTSGKKTNSRLLKEKSRLRILTAANLSVFCSVVSSETLKQQAHKYAEEHPGLRFLLNSGNNLSRPGTSGSDKNGNTPTNKSALVSTSNRKKDGSVRSEEKKSDKNISFNHTDENKNNDTSNSTEGVVIAPRGESWWWNGKVFLERFFHLVDLFTDFKDELKCHGEFLLLEKYYPIYRDPFVNSVVQEELIGVSFLHIDRMTYLLDMDEYLRIINYRGQTCGYIKLHVRCWIDKVEPNPSYITVDKECNLREYLPPPPPQKDEDGKDINTENQMTTYGTTSQQSANSKVSAGKADQKLPTGNDKNKSAAATAVGGAQANKNDKNKKDIKSPKKEISIQESKKNDTTQKPSSEDTNTNSSDTNKSEPPKKKHKLIINFHFDHLGGLPANHCAETYVFFRFYRQFPTHRTPILDGRSTMAVMDHIVQIEEPITSDLLEFISSGCLEFEVFGKRKSTLNFSFSESRERQNMRGDCYIDDGLKYDRSLKRAEAATASELIASEEETAKLALAKKIAAKASGKASSGSTNNGHGISNTEKDQELQHRREQNEELQREVEDLASELQAKKHELRRSLKEAEVARKDVELLRKQTRTDLTEKTTKIEELTSEKDELLQRLQRMETQLEALKTRGGKPDGMDSSIAGQSVSSGTLSYLSFRRPSVRGMGSILGGDSVGGGSTRSTISGRNNKKQTSNVPVQRQESDISSIGDGTATQLPEEGSKACIIQ